MLLVHDRLIRMASRSKGTGGSVGREDSVETNDGDGDYEGAAATEESANLI